MSEFAGYLGVCFLVIATPGQDTALVIRNTLLGGRRGGVLTSLGVVGGQATWTLATSAGLAALLVASEPAFMALRLGGAFYLVFLGGQALWNAFRARGPKPSFAPPAAGLGPAVALRQGLISNLGNAKVAVFFTSLLPQFTPEGRASFAALLGLGLVFCAMTLAWLTGYAFLVARAGGLLRRSAVRRSLEGLLGAVLVGLGLRIAAEHR